MTRRPGAGEDWIALVEKIIEGSPKLDGARCADYPGMFDARDVGESRSSVEERHRLAVGLCHACPALASVPQPLRPGPRPASRRRRRDRTEQTSNRAAKK